MDTELAEKKTTTSTLDKYLTLFLEDEKYGIDIAAVHEIIAMMYITKIPKTPSFLEGVMNLRGIIIPVVNLRTKFGMKHKDSDDRTAIVIVKIQENNIGLIVDGVEEVQSVENDQYAEAPKFDTKIDNTLISKMVRNDNDVVMVLDLDKVFNEGELDFLDGVGDDDKTAP